MPHRWQPQQPFHVSSVYTHKGARRPLITSWPVVLGAWCSSYIRATALYSVYWSAWSRLIKSGRRVCSALTMHSNTCILNPGYLWYNWLIPLLLTLIALYVLHTWLFSFVFPAQWYKLVYTVPIPMTYVAMTLGDRSWHRFAILGAKSDDFYRGA